MRHIRIGTRAVAAVAIAAGLFTTIGVGSAAAASNPSGDATLRGNAPTCVTVWVDRGIATQTGHAQNNCGRSLNLKIVWAHGADGSCNTVPNGYTLKSKVAIAPRVFDGANTC